jgi:Ras-related protein Rab-35
VLIVYDVTNGESFARVRRWIDEINKYCDDSIAKVLVGNKDDQTTSDDKRLEKIVSTSDAQQYAQQMSLAFFETSAKDNKNVDEAFYAVTRLALYQRLEARRKTQAIAQNDMRNSRIRSTSQTIRLNGSRKSKKKDRKHLDTCCK